MRDIAAPYAAMAENLRTTLAQAIQPTALLAASRLGEQLRDTSKTTSRYEKALLSMGWWLPPSMPASQFFRIGRLADGLEGSGTQRRRRAWPIAPDGRLHRRMDGLRGVRGAAANSSWTALRTIASGGSA